MVERLNPNQLNEVPKGLYISRQELSLLRLPKGRDSFKRQARICTLVSVIGGIFTSLAYSKTGSQELIKAYAALVSHQLLSLMEYDRF